MGKGGGALFLSGIPPLWVAVGCQQNTLVRGRISIPRRAKTRFRSGTISRGFWHSLSPGPDFGFEIWALFGESHHDGVVTFTLVAFWPVRLKNKEKLASFAFLTLQKVCPDHRAKSIVLKTRGAFAPGGGK